MLIDLELNAFTLQLYTVSTEHCSGLNLHTSFHVKSFVHNSPAALKSQGDGKYSLDLTLGSAKAMYYYIYI